MCRCHIRRISRTPMRWRLSPTIKSNSVRVVHPTTTKVVVIKRKLFSSVFFTEMLIMKTTLADVQWYILGCRIPGVRLNIEVVTFIKSSWTQARTITYISNKDEHLTISKEPKKIVAAHQCYQKSFHSFVNKIESQCKKAQLIQHAKYSITYWLFMVLINQIVGDVLHKFNSVKEAL